MLIVFSSRFLETTEGKKIISPKDCLPQGSKKREGRKSRSGTWIQQ
jgi:hypothetical protein